jgi:DNA-binding transcriptional LysR family regulator
MIDEMRTFIKAVDLKGLSAAARDLRVSPACASWRVQKLEAYLGVKLLAISTRALRPTAAGLRFYDQAAKVVEAMEFAKASMVDMGGVLSGDIRVAAPLQFGARFLAPMASAFTGLNPKTKVQLRLSHRQVHFIAEPIDLGLRIGPLQEATVVARKIAECPTLLCASPAYLAARGQPKRPEDLVRHDCLLSNDVRSPGQWTIGAGDMATTVSISARLAADDERVLTQWAREGAGIVMMPQWEARSFLNRGELVPVLPGYRCPPQILYLCFMNREWQPPAVRAFADFLAHKLARHPDLREIAPSSRPSRSNRTSAGSRKAEAANPDLHYVA